MAASTSWYSPYVRSRLWEAVGHGISGGIIAHPAGRVNGFGARGCETGAVRTLLRRGTIVALLASLGYAVWRAASARSRGGGPTYEAQPFPMPPRPVAAPVASRSSVQPESDGSCPVTHPIKGKLSSGIYHRPGAFAYERTRADRCYRDETAAESDGLRASKR